MAARAMKSSRRRFLNSVASVVSAPLFSCFARAQAYPSRPVRLIVPFAPGGQTDTIARLLGQKLSEHYGQQFFVENVPGAGGNLGMGRAAQAPSDGYTLLIADGTSFVVNPTLYPKVPYDPYKDFDPITAAASTTIVLAVHPSLPARTMRQLVELIKANPGKYSYSSAGVGTSAHLIGELFRISLGLDLVHVPFAGAGPGVASIIAGHTPIGFGSPAATVAHVQEGTLRALAVASKTRIPALPDVPTMAESGYPDMVSNQWVGGLVPAGTPPAIVAALNRDIKKIMVLPDVQERLAALGFEALANSSEEMAVQIRTDIEIWAKIIRAAGIRAQ
jgi:tripartite-type tricarboxylate transporter receptor subunit TctC